ncbi:copper-binding protein [Azohydromonas caseinilytica]|uniref:Copper-binding protein n=1 Tax=Azohydromonas caseinilytica TaxID=2728836 RepID=A0A848FC88_9BURK|nr:copper-binding protein [Azohydromonas caseinilytica]NML16938.1 copper-binding protein [Azohydromonas caseinilytica]
MNKNLLLAALLACAGILPVAAQTSEADHAAHHPAGASAAAPAAADMTEGEVRRIDKAGAKITLKHGDIKNLDMPPMTMVFQVKDAALLDTVKVGDKVRFQAQREGGAFVVTQLQPGQ